MGTITVAKVAEVTSSFDIFEDTRDLVEEGTKHIVPEKRQEFEHQIVATQRDFIEKVLEEVEKYIVPEKRQEFEHRIVATQRDFIEKVLEEVEKYIVPEEKLEFELQVTLELRDFIETLSKKVKVHSNGGWAKTGKKWRELRAKRERYKRRLKLSNPSSQQDFETTLRWMAENGVEEDLDLLRRVKKNPLYSSENIEPLLEIAEQWICERVYDPDYVLEKGEEAYQQNKEEWDREYAGHYIAIHRGQVVDCDLDKSKLTERLAGRQREQGSFRAYIVETGVSESTARRPGARLQGTRPRDAGEESAETSETDVREVSWVTFRRELPWLLEEIPGQWVAFHGERQVALGTSKLEVYRQLEQAGCPLQEVVVSRIEPLGPPVDLRRFRRVWRR